MGDISIPRGLSSADAALSFADSLQKLLDPTERKKIADDIKSHHALNATEAQKAEDARNLIKKHTEILNETHRIAEQNKKDSASLHKEREEFQTEIGNEKSKIADKWTEVNVIKENVEKLHEESKSQVEDVAKREKILKEEKLKHAGDVEKLKVDKDALDKETKKIGEIKKQHEEILSSMKAKKEAIAAFNV